MKLRQKWSYPQTFQLLELSCPSCLFSFVWVFLQPMKSWVTWENGMCMGDGDRLGHAQDEASLCNCHGSAYHIVWAFWGIWSTVSESVWTPHSKGKWYSPTPCISHCSLPESTKGKTVCFLWIQVFPINNVLFHIYNTKISQTLFWLIRM